MAHPKKVRLPIIERQHEPRNQHAVEYMWKTYRMLLRKRLGRAPKPEVIAAHKQTYYAAFTEAYMTILRATQLTDDPLKIAYWIGDILLELQETVEVNQWV